MDSINKNQVFARNGRATFLTLFLLLAGMLAAPVLSPSSAEASPAVPPAQSTWYFVETGHNVSGLFLQNFVATGGITTNGLPLTEEFTEDEGMTIQVFERAILELHQPLENEGQAQPQPYVEHRLLGSILTAARNFPPATPEIINSARHYFSETRHTLTGSFYTFWSNHGGLAEFGYPVSEEFVELNPADGKNYTVQYFERARFEHHPEAAGTQYEVQLGLLGRQYAGAHYPASLFAPAPSQATQPQSQVKIPSLMYHHIRDLTQPLNSALNNYSVTPAAFVAQLDWLKAQGYHTVTISQIASHLRYGTLLPDKPVNLRFDDGWQNQLFAASEMKKRGMTATFFVLTKATTYPYMTPAQLKQLDADGFEVASHTRSHPFLTKNGADYDWAQISGSKDDLEKLLGHPVRSFAYPYGDHNRAIDSMVEKAGYDVGVGIGWGQVWKANTLFNEPTISVSNVRTLSDFIRRATQGS